MQDYLGVLFFMRRPNKSRVGFGRLVCLAMVLLTRLIGADPAPLRVGVLTDNYPFSFRENDGSQQGFAYELVKEIEQVMGLKFERITGVTGEINADFVAGRLDLLQSYGQFPERDAQADFSVPYLIMTGDIFVRKEESRIRGLPDLKGRRVFVHRGSLGETVLQRAGMADSIVYVESVEQGMIKLNNGEGDAVLVSRLNGVAMTQRLGLKKIRGLRLNVEGYEVRYCIAVRKGHPVLLAQINEGLAILVRNGRFEAIYQKWFGRMERNGYTAEQVMGAVAVGLALALAVALWAGVKQRALRKRIAQQAEALRASEERHRGIFEGTHEGLLVLQRNPRGLSVEQINPAAIRLLAAAITPPAANQWGELLAADAALLARLEAAVAAGGIQEFEHERPAGGWLRVVVGPLGERTMVTLANISEQVQARDRLRQQDEQIRQKQKLEAVGTLAGGVAHDFNNLLTSIMGNTELCLMGLPADHPETDGMKQVLRASKRARDLVRQILSFSRQAAPGRELVVVRPLVSETIDLLKTLARSSVIFEVDFPADLPPIKADPVQVHQVLMNIGTNAVQAMRGAATSGRLIFRAEQLDVTTALPAQYPPGLRSGGYVRLAIQDDGPGMTPEVQARVFEPFYTTKAPGEGTGLGLSVVHGIMQQHDGAVTLYSQVGRGTLFHLYFPVATEVVRGKVELRPEHVPTGRGERVLLIDDESAIVDMVGKMLGQLGYQVTAAGRADEAWAEFSAQPDAFHLVLSDLTMPGMTGLKLLEQVRALRPGQAFVLTSGFFSEAEHAQATAFGVTAFLLKPMSYEELGRVLAIALVGRN